MSALARCRNIDDLRRLARRRAHASVFHYIDGGADDEVSLRRSVSDFDDYVLPHQVLRDVSTIDTGIALLGSRLSVPFFFSPSAGNRLFHKDGEAAVARVAQEVGTAYCLSTLSTVSIEDVAAIGPDPRWFQLYVWKDRGLVREMLARAKAAGYGALILTADFAVAGNRERDLKTGFTIPPKLGARQVIDALAAPAWTLDWLTSPPIRYANLSQTTDAVSLVDFVNRQLSPDFTWKDAEWLLGEWSGPALLKGVVRPDDARQAIRSGFNGVMISNHGGRQLDGSPSPISVLPRIREAVQDGAVILDGGVRRGTHIVKALALGADAVSFARPYLWGLAAGGAAGVRRAAEILTHELRRDLALLGVARIGDLGAAHVERAGPGR